MSQVYIPHILLIIWGVISMIVMKQVGSKSSEVDNANNIWVLVKVDGPGPLLQLVTWNYTIQLKNPFLKQHN